MNKYDYIHSLEQVKLILGNGYDLHCKLHSSYKDYLIKNRTLYKYIHSLIDEYKIAFNDEVYFLKNETFKKVDLTNINLWDFIFALYDQYNNSSTCWFDIEELIKKTLEQKDVLSYGVSFKEILNVIREKKKDGDFYSDICASFIINKSQLNKIYHTHNFYAFVLEELNDFEINFGLFIRRQRKNIDSRWFSIGLENERYKKCADTTIKILCNYNSVVSVDNFNYDDCGFESFKTIERNINGDYESPIIGVDSVFSPGDEQIVFTKTYRRMIADMNRIETEKPASFKHVIIYGHSLDEADYSYFFPIFNKLNLLDSNADGTIVFAFTIYDSKKEHEIKSKLNKSIYKIIESYANIKGLKDKEIIRLVDYLSIQKRIIMYEIPELTGRDYNYKTYFDYDFEDDEK